MQPRSPIVNKKQALATANGILEGLLTTSVRMTGVWGISYCCRNSATLSPLRRSTFSTSNQDGSIAHVAHLRMGRYVQKGGASAVVVSLA